MISTHFFNKKPLWVHVMKNPGINSLDIIPVRVLIICVAFSTCSVVVVVVGGGGGGGGETIGVNGVPTLLADSMNWYYLIAS